MRSIGARLRRCALLLVVVVDSQRSTVFRGANGRAVSPHGVVQHRIAAQAGHRPHAGPVRGAKTQESGAEEESSFFAGVCRQASIAVRVHSRTWYGKRARAPRSARLRGTLIFGGVVRSSGTAFPG